jgi:hypothetical protein
MRFNMTNNKSFKWNHTALFDSLVYKYKSLLHYDTITRVKRIQLRLSMLHLLFKCFRNDVPWHLNNDSWREGISLIIEGHRICNIFSDTLTSDIYLYHIDTASWDEKAWVNYMDLPSYRESLEKGIKMNWNGEFVNWDPNQSREQFQTVDKAFGSDDDEL